jgi:hypothetical protein
MEKRAFTQSEFKMTEAERTLALLLAYRQSIEALHTASRLIALVVSKGQLSPSLLREFYILVEQWTDSMGYYPDCDEYLTLDTPAVDELSYGPNLEAAIEFIDSIHYCYGKLKKKSLSYAVDEALGKFDEEPDKPV